MSVTWTSVGSEQPEAKGVLVEFTEAAEGVQLTILLDALKVYGERNARYKDNWKRMGWRGMLIRIRERAERLWDQYWDGEAGDNDDAYDLINFACFMIRALDGEATRGGEWW